MSEPKHQSERSRRKRTVRLSVALFAILALLTATAFVSKPERLRPGHVVDKAGEYRLPSGSTLKIAEDDAGNVHVTVRQKSTRFYCIPYFYSDRITVFGSERDWFASVDEYDRIWVYHGHWDRKWGELRKMPSGGTVPYAPAVLRDGLAFYAPNRLGRGSEVVTATGNWAGVPQEFLNRIPDRNGAQWGNVPAIPKTAPKFTKQQEMQMASRLR